MLRCLMIGSVNVHKYVLGLQQLFILPLPCLSIFLKLNLFFLSRHSNPKVTSNTGPSKALTAAPTAVPFLDDDDDDDGDDEGDDEGDDDDGDDNDNGDADAEANANAVALTVAVTVIGVVFVLFGDVEPDVRLKITFPASI